jgi:hypothetical protein
VLWRKPEPALFANAPLNSPTQYRFPLPRSVAWPRLCQPNQPVYVPWPQLSLPAPRRPRQHRPRGPPLGADSAGPRGTLLRGLPRRGPRTPRWPAARLLPRPLSSHAAVARRGLRPAAARCPECPARPSRALRLAPRDRSAPPGAAIRPGAAGPPQGRGCCRPTCLSLTTSSTRTAAALPSGSLCPSRSVTCRRDSARRAGPPSSAAFARSRARGSANSRTCAGRLIGSIRRECLNHVLVLGERHLRRILARHFAYYHRVRIHLSLDKDATGGRPIEPPALGRTISVPKSMACIIAMSAGRRSPAQPGQSSPTSTRLLTPFLASDRAPSSTQAPVLAWTAERLKVPTALLSTSLGVFACQKNTDARQASPTRFWRRTGRQASAHPTTHAPRAPGRTRFERSAVCAPWRRWLRGSPSAHASAIEADVGERRGSRKAMSAGVD